MMNFYICTHYTIQSLKREEDADNNNTKFFKISKISLDIGRNLWYTILK